MFLSTLLSFLCPSFLISEIEMIIPASPPRSLALSLLLQTFSGYHLPRAGSPALDSNISPSTQLTAHELSFMGKQDPCLPFIIHF